MDDSEGRSKACYAKTKKVVDSYSVHKPQEVSSSRFILISYYFDRALDSGLLGEFFFACFMISMLFQIYSQGSI